MVSFALYSHLLKRMNGVERGGTNLIRTLRAPKGVTTVAGANMYAAKLATSPVPTEKHTHKSVHYAMQYDVMTSAHHVMTFCLYAELCYATLCNTGLQCIMSLFLKILTIIT